MSDQRQLEFVEPSVRAKELSKLFPLRAGTVWARPGVWVYPKAIETHYKALSQFQFEEGDVTVMSVPKCGSTWTVETVWTMRNNPNLDNPQAKTQIRYRIPLLGAELMLAHIDMEAGLRATFMENVDAVGPACASYNDCINAVPRPRVLKTHISFNILSPTVLDKGKVVYVIRDPRDACLSHYHYNRIMKNFPFVGSFDQYIEAYMEGALWMGTYWTHVAEAWKHRHHPNMFIMFYEKIKENPKEELTKLDNFLGTGLTEEQIEKVVYYTSFDEMKKRNYHIMSSGNPEDHEDQNRTKNEGGFYRSGKAGGWKEALTPEQKKMFESWIKENCPDDEIMKNIGSP